MKICSVGGCGQPHRAKGLCNAHYKRLQRETNPTKISAQKMAWFAANPDKVIASRQKYYAAHRDKILKGNRKWRESNQDKLRQTQRKYVSAHREQTRQSQRKYQEANPIKTREAIHRWYLANRKTVLEKRRAWRERNADLMRELRRRWSAANPEKIKEHRRNATNTRRARKASASGSFTIADWKVLVSRSPRCHWCGKPWTRCRQPTHDHVTPLSKGGSHSIENSVCACRHCNSRKLAKMENPATGQGILL